MIIISCNYLCLVTRLNWLDQYLSFFRPYEKLESKTMQCLVHIATSEIVFRFKLELGRLNFLSSECFHP